MCFADQIQPGMYLAEVYAEGGGELEHHFVAFYRTEALKHPSEELLRTIWVAYPRTHPELVKVALVPLREASLWESLQDHLSVLKEAGVEQVHAVNFNYAPKHELRDRAEMAIALLNVMNRAESITGGVEGLMADPGDGALVLIQSCLHVLRLHSGGLEGLDAVNETVGQEMSAAMIDRLQVSLEKDGLVQGE